MRQVRDSILESITTHLNLEAPLIDITYPKDWDLEKCLMFRAELFELLNKYVTKQDS